jgi:hypothetical protein
MNWAREIRGGASDFTSMRQMTGHAERDREERGSSQQKHGSALVLTQARIFRITTFEKMSVDSVRDTGRMTRPDPTPVSTHPAAIQNAPAGF